MEHKPWLNLLVVCALLAVFGGATAAIGTGHESDGTILYVDWEAAGANDGTSWEDAFVDLQPALEAAAPGD